MILSEEASAKDDYAKKMIDSIVAVCNAIGDARAYAGPPPRELSEKIGLLPFLPKNGIGFDATLDLAKKEILPYFLRTASTDYMAHLHSPALFESLSAEVVLSAFNQSMDSWDQSPVATEVEVSVVRHLCALFGYGLEADGTFTSGGSQSNFTAILLARDAFCSRVLHRNIKKEGLPPEYTKLRLYTSELSHFSMEKSAHVLGLGYDAVVKVPVDSTQRMDMKALRSLIQKDKEAGNLPFCIVVTIGTTDFGSIDSVEEAHRIAQEEGLYLHADAAYGGALILSEKYKERMGNLSLCDSITVDFHKMFLLSISCSCVLVKNKAYLDPLELHAAYLNRKEDEEDGYTNLVGKSLQTTRRFDALKVWMAFNSLGKNGYEAIIDTCIQNAAYVYEKICEEKSFVPLVKPEISSVVFRIRANDEQNNNTLNRLVRRELLHKKGIVIGQTECGSFVHLKFTLLNPRLTKEKLDNLLKTIVALGKESGL